MAIQIKLIASGHLPQNTTSYTALTPVVGNGKAQIIKNMRFCNTTGANIVLTVAVYSTSFVGTGPDEKVVFSQTTASGTVSTDPNELSLEAGQQLRFKTGSGGGPIDYVISGIERDVGGCATGNSRFPTLVGYRMSPLLGQFISAYDGADLKLGRAKNANVSHNLAVCAPANPLKTFRCGTVTYFNNKTPAGVLIQGYKGAAQTEYSELETIGEDASLLTLT